MMMFAPPPGAEEGSIRIFPEPCSVCPNEHAHYAPCSDCPNRVRVDTGVTPGECQSKEVRR